MNGKGKNPFFESHSANRLVVNSKLTKESFSKRAKNLAIRSKSLPRRKKKGRKEGRRKFRRSNSIGSMTGARGKEK